MSYWNNNSGNDVARRNSLSHLPFPCFQPAVNEVENNIQSGQGMALMSALSAVSLVTQGIVSAELPHGSIVPCSQMILILAGSGERKSTVFNAFYKAIREFDAESRRCYERQLADWKEKDEAYNGDYRAARKQLQKAKVRGEPLVKYEKVIDKLQEERPEIPVLYRVLFEDATGPGFFKAIAKDFPYVGQISTEGGSVLKNTAFNDLSKQNLAWDGMPIIVDRASGDSYVVEGARITTLIMVQPMPLQKYVEKKGDEVRGSGLWARFIVWQPQSMQGCRNVNNFTASWEHRDRFNERIKELVEESAKRFQYGVEPQALSLSAEAQDTYLDYYNYVEKEQLAGGRYYDASDHASKLSENAVRIAASLHVFEGFEGDISTETMAGAIRIVDSASHHFLNVFVPPPQEELDAMVLNEWFNKYRYMNQIALAKTYIRQHAPNKLREKNRLNRALECLLMKGAITYWMRGRTQMVTFGSVI